MGLFGSAAGGEIILAKQGTTTQYIYAYEKSGEGAKAPVFRETFEGWELLDDSASGCWLRFTSLQKLVISDTPDGEVERPQNYVTTYRINCSSLLNEPAVPTTPGLGKKPQLI